MDKSKSKKVYIKTSAVILFLIVCFFPLFKSSAESTGQEVIRDINVVGLSRIESEELIDMMCFHVGEIFDKEILKKCIRRTFKKGIFLDIRVDSERIGDGIKLTYVMREFPVISDIYIKGNNGISKKLIMKALSFDEDDDFREDLLQKAEKNIISLYKRKGFYDTAVKISFNNPKNISKVNIDVKIDEGIPLRIKSINMPDEALRRTGISVNDIYDSDILDKEITKLKGYYIKQGYIRPEVGPYELRDGELYLPVNPGVKFEIEFKENTVFSNKKLLKEMPFIESEMVSDELIEEASNRIRDLYLQSGYCYVQVAAGVENFKELTKITFIVFEGKKVTIGRVDFEGMSIDRKVVKKMIPLKENDLYNEDLLANSSDSIEGFYNALGYINMKIVNVRKDFENDGGVINLTFEIDEGIQVMINGLDINGNIDIPVSDIRNVINLRKNTPLNLVDIRDARYSILSLYKRLGYVDASVDIATDINEGEADIHFSITENRPSVLGKVIIRGNRKTREKIIRREFTLAEGGPYNYDEILKIKQSIYKMGLFNEVSIDELTSEKLSYKTVKDVLVSLKEDQAGSVEVALGYGDYEQFRGSLDVSYINLGGYNRQIGFRGEASSVEQKYGIEYIEPWLFNKRDLNFRASLSKEGRKNVNLDTRDILFEIDKLSIVAGINKEFADGIKANLSYEYSLNETSNLEPGVILNREDAGTLAIGSILASVFYDTRNNPFDPSSGSINGVVIKFASKAFLSEVEFIKGTFQSSWYFELRKGLVFATSVKGGASYSYDKDDELPLVERFFLGGRTTVRGYSHDTLGPKGIEDVPTGGNIYALINEELRIAVGKGFGFVVFLDGGNVWQTAGDVDSKLKFTAGVGLRYITPVGPVRIDYGHKLDRDAGESPGELHFSFGHAF
ncbi:MAG: outer membrane protein assembly factor BamA [Thermodesulfovibrionia bacterium]|nr:outer membrane protein assembly factor BamA [Thermodesulfovibrionia bacterium]